MADFPLPTPFDYSRLQTVAACDSMIKAQKELIKFFGDMLRSDERRLRTAISVNSRIEQELGELNVQLPALEANIAALPDGALKNMHSDRRDALQLRLLTLQQRAPKLTKEEREKKYPDSIARLTVIVAHHKDLLENTERIRKEMIEGQQPKS